MHDFSLLSVEAALGLSRLAVTFARVQQHELGKHLYLLFADLGNFLFVFVLLLKLRKPLSDHEGVLLCQAFGYSMLELFYEDRATDSFFVSVELLLQVADQSLVLVGLMSFVLFEVLD